MVEKENTTAYISLVEYKIYIFNKKNLARKNWLREIKNVVIHGVLNPKKHCVWGENADMGFMDCSADKNLRKFKSRGY